MHFIKFCKVPLYFLVVLISISSHALSNEEVTSFYDNLEVSSDRIVEELVQKYSESHHYEFWVPFSEGIDDQHREVVQIDQIEKKEIEGKYIQWRHTQLGLEHYVFGLTTNSIDIYDSKLEKKSSIGVDEKSVAMTVFTKWNYESFQPEIIIAVVTSNPSINVYRVQNGEIRKISGAWPLHTQISSIESTYAGDSVKLILTPADKPKSIDIYSIEVKEDSVQIWYHQRLDSNNTSNVVVYDIGSDSLIACASRNVITVYKYHNNEGKYARFITIHTEEESKRLDSFTLGYHNYLVSTPNSEKSVEFFIFNATTYQPTNFGNIKASELAFVKIEWFRDEPVLVTRQNSGTLTFFSYSKIETNEEFREYQACSKTDVCSYRGSLSNGISFIANNQVVYLLPAEDKSSSGRAIFISTSILETFSPLYKQSRDSFNDFSELSTKYLRWDNVTTRVSRILQNSLSLEKPNIVTEKWSVRALSGSHASITEHRSDDKSLPGFGNAFNDFTFVNSKWLTQDFSVALGEVELMLNAIRKQTDAALVILADCVPLNSEELHTIRAVQKITGDLRCESLDSTSLQVASINEIQDVTEFLSSISRRESTLTLNSLTFKGLLLANDLDATSLNGIIVGEIARLSQANEFHCPLEFTNSFSVDGNAFTTTVNNLELGKNVLKISNINGVKLVNGLVAEKEVHVSGPVDSVIIDKQVFNQILLKSVPQKISAHYSLLDVECKQIVRIGEVNGKNFAEEVRHIVTQGYSGTVSGHKSITGGISCDSAWISESLNGLAFPDDYIFASQSRITLSGIKIFNHLIASRVNCAGLVDGISTSNLVPREGFAAVTRSWTLSGAVEFYGDIKVEGLVDGIHIDSLNHQDTLDIEKSTYNPDAEVEFLQPVSFRNLAVELINGKTYDELFHGILSLDGTQINVVGQTTFRKSIKIDVLNVKSGQINGHHINSYFTLNTAQNISGNKIMESSTKFSTLYALKKLDSIELGQLLENSVSLSKSRILSEFAFEDLTCGSSLKVRNNINDFGKEFGTKVAVISGRKVQEFLVPLRFHGLYTESCRIGNLKSTFGKTVGSLDFESWLQRRIALNGNSIISSKLKVTGSVDIKRHVNASKLNGIPLKRLASGVLRRDISDQVFLEEVNLLKVVKVRNGHVNFKKSVSGFNLRQIFENAFPLNGENEELILHTWFIEKVLVKNSLDVSGLVCGTDLSHLHVDIIRKDESFITIHGKKSFVSDLEINKILTLNLVNSAALFSHVFTLSTAQNIAGSTQFSHNLLVKGDLLITGLINQDSIRELARLYSFDTSSKTHVLNYDVEADSLKSITLAVQKLVQNKQFIDYVKNNILRTSDSINISGTKSFEKVVDVSGDISTASLNEINVAALASRIAKKSDKTLRFSETVVFNRSAEIPKIIIQFGNVLFEDLVNLDFKKLVSEAIHLDSEDTLGKLNFDSIIVLSNINNVQKLNEISVADIVTTHSSQNLEDLTVKTVTFSAENVNVGGLIFGQDLKLAFENTLMRSSPTEQVVEGLLELDRVTINGKFQCLKDVNEIIAINREHTITSLLEFRQPIEVVDLEIKNLINGHKIEEIASHALIQGKAEEITGYWTFAKGVTFKSNVEGESLLDGFDIDVLVDTKKDEAAEAEKLVQEEQTKFVKKSNDLDSLAILLDTSPCKLQSVDTHQIIQSTSRIERIATLKTSKDLYLYEFQETCQIAIHRWDRKQEQFINSGQTLRLGDITKWRSVQVADTGVLAFITQTSTRSPVAAGLYVLTLQPTSDSVPSPTLLSTESFKTVEIVQRVGDIKTLLFALNQENQIHVYEWNINDGKFDETFKVNLPCCVEDLAISNYLEGVALFYHSQESIHFDYYPWSDKIPKSLGQAQFLATEKSVVGLIENSGSIYGFVEGKDTLPECTLQVFEYRKDVNLIQKFKATRATSMSTLEFCGINYVVSFSKSNGMTMYAFKGLSGFEIFNKYPVKVPSNSNDMIIFEEYVLEYDKHVPFFVISNSKSIEILHSNVIG